MLTDNEFTKILGWPGYRVSHHEIDEKAKILRLWLRRKRGNRVLWCPSCGRRVHDIHDVYEREVRDLPCFEFQTAVIIELYRIRCPDCGVKAEKVELLPSKAPYSKRFEDAVGRAPASDAALHTAHSRTKAAPASTAIGLARSAASQKPGPAQNIPGHGCICRPDPFHRSVEEEGLSWNRCLEVRELQLAAISAAACPTCNPSGPRAAANPPGRWP